MRNTKPTRIELLDILRGFAILGTLGTNIWLFAAAGNYAALLSDMTDLNNVNTVIENAVLFLTNGKFLGLLTILFGVGLEIQYKSAQRRGTPFLPAYLWRSALLFLDGVLHFLLVIEWDILMGYAITAMIVAFIVPKTDRVICAAMWIAGGLHVLMVSALVIVVSTVSDAELERSLGGEATRAYLDGTYWQQITYRAQNALEFRLEPIFVIPMGIALLLFGVHLFRAGAFAGDANGARLRRGMMRWGLGVGVPLNLLALLPGLSLDIAARYLFAPIMSIGYIGLIAHALERGWLRRLSHGLANVGRMALSNYMLQNVLASALFYGWGLGLARNPNVFVTLAAWLVISLTLVAFSGAWLRRFSAGPFETVWKRLSELPFKRGREAARSRGEASN